MNKYTYLSAALLATPYFAAAQGPTFQNLFTNLLIFINSTVIPFLLGIAFLFLAINVVRYFIIGGSSEEGRDKAKNLAIYGAGAFVFIMIFWGIVNMLASSTGLDGGTPMKSDYIQRGAAPRAATTPTPTTPAAPALSPTTPTPTTPDCSTIAPEDPSYAGCLSGS